MRRSLPTALLVALLLVSAAPADAKPQKDPFKSSLKVKDAFPERRRGQHDARKAEDRDRRDRLDLMEQRVIERQLDHPEMMLEDDESERGIKGPQGE